jgi:hypothetical protein
MRLIFKMLRYLCCFLLYVNNDLQIKAVLTILNKMFLDVMGRRLHIQGDVFEGGIFDAKFERVARKGNLETVLVVGVEPVRFLY